MNDPRRAMWMMVLFTVLWTAVEATAATLLARYSAYQVVWTRYAVHVALLAALFAWREPSALWRTGRTGTQIGRSLLMLVMPASWAIATQWGVPAGTTMAVFWLAPMMVLAWAALVLGERAPLWTWGLCALASLGGVVLFRPSSPGGGPADWALLAAPLAMAASFSLYLVVTRTLRTERLRTNLFHTAFWVLVALTPVMPSVWITPTPTDLARMLLVGALGLLALWSADRLAAAAAVSVSAPLCYLQLTTTIVLMVGLGEARLDRQHLLALALVSLPVFLLLARKSWPRHVTEPA
ncbi:MAG: DMT family transporter [Rubrivivax sp.]|nr:DMT family transporter [Rubrivivax sp.]